MMQETAQIFVQNVKFFSGKCFASAAAFLLPMCTGHLYVHGIINKLKKFAFKDNVVDKLWFSAVY